LPPPGSELLALDNASKYFGTVIALEDVSMNLLAVRSTRCWETTAPGNRR
jgi:hypothetical protein